jgi:hypothetical protein
MKAYRVHEYGDVVKFIEDEVNKPKIPAYLSPNNVIRSTAPDQLGLD